METGRQFLERADRLDLLADVPGLAEASDKRMATCLVVESLKIGETQPANEALIEGIVSRAWEKGDQRFARLAIYDEHTALEGEGRKGRPRRIAHYVSVHFPDGLVAGRDVALSQKDHVRVIGWLNERRYSESLGYFLMRAGAIGLLSEAPNADEHPGNPRVAGGDVCGGGVAAAVYEVRRPCQSRVTSYQVDLVIIPDFVGQVFPAGARFA